MLSTVVSLLAGKGFTKLAGVVADKGLDFVKEKTGLDLNLEELKGKLETEYDTFEKELKKAELLLQDKKNARETYVKVLNSATNNFVKSFTNVYALVVTILTFLVYYMIFSNPVIMEGALKDVALIIIGAVSANFNSVVSFFFGSSKTEADSRYNK